MIPGPRPMVAAIDLNPIDLLSVLRYPIGWMIEELSKAFNSVGVLRAIGPFGLAVVVTTLIIRALVFPIMGWNLRTQRRIQREQRLVAPQLNEIRKRFKGQTRKISDESQKVYAEHGISPFSSMSGCVPLLVQMPVLYGLYWSIRDVLGSNANVTFDRLPAGFVRNFLWIKDVAKTISYSLGSATGVCSVTAKSCATDWGHLISPPTNLALLIFPILTGLAYFIQSKMTMQPMRPDMSDMERQMAGSMRTVVYFMPLMSLLFGFIWPQALTLYWMTAALVMVGQQYQLMGWGSLRVPGWIPGAGRTTPLSYTRSDLDASAAMRATPASGGTASSNGSRRSGRGTSPLPESGPPASPGRGRAPSRAQKKARRRR